MKLTVLIDNNTLIDRYFVGEPGVSYYIEDGDKKVLFDLGYSSAFLSNGDKMGIDFRELDYVVISHSHLDHTWGLEPLLRRYTEDMFERRFYKLPKLVAHPDIFLSRTFYGKDEFGISVGKDKVLRYFEDGLTKEPFWLTDRLVFLGGIPRTNSFEAKYSIGKVVGQNGLEEDFNMDDSALCYKSDEGLVIITGCSHSGICNIIAYAQEVCGEKRIKDVIGGFHLLDPAPMVLNETVSFFDKLDIQRMHPCHCTDLKSKIALSKAVDVQEVGVGLVLEF